MCELAKIILFLENLIAIKMARINRINPVLLSQSESE